MALTFDDLPLLIARSRGPSHGAAGIPRRFSVHPDLAHVGGLVVVAALGLAALLGRPRLVGIRAVLHLHVVGPPLRLAHLLARHPELPATPRQRQHEESENDE